MRLNSRSSLIALGVALAFFVQTIGAPGAAVAGWEDRSDELPGTDSDVTPYLVVGGLVVAGFVVYKLAKKKPSGAENAGSETPAEPEATGETVDDAPEQATATGQEERAEATTRPAGTGLKFRLGVDPHVSSGATDAGSWDLSDVEFKVGLSLGF